MQKVQQLQVRPPSLLTFVVLAMLPCFSSFLVILVLVISEVDETGTFEKDLLTTGAADASAVTVLVSGTAVGPARGGLLNLRHPASAFVP